MNQHSSGPLETILYVVVALLTAGVMGLAGHREPAPQIAEIAPKFQSDPDTLEPAAKPPAAEQHDAGQDAPAVEWLTWPEASAESKATGRPVLVLQHFRDPADHAACLPCQRLEKTLSDPETFGAFAKLGIPCKAVAEDWQTGKITAPALAMVPAKAGEKDEVQSLTGFRVAPAGDFLEDVKAWLDGLAQ